MSADGQPNQDPQAETGARNASKERGLAWLARGTRSIRASIVLGFAAVVIFTGALGLYGNFALDAVARIVADTYDGPLMAINYARSAQLDFVLMEQATLEGTLDHADAKTIKAKLDELRDGFFGDLEVARGRAMSKDERGVIDTIRAKTTDWLSLVAQGKVVQAKPLSTEIAGDFDTLIEMTAGHSFVERRSSVHAAERFVTVSIVGIVATTFLSLAVALFLAKRILEPLGAAVAVANRIGEGEFQTALPPGHTDEIRALFHSMGVMQERIGEMVAREQARRQSAQARLVDAVEAARDAMLLIDNHGHNVLANSGFAALVPQLAPLIGCADRIRDIDDHFAARPDLSAPEEIDAARIIELGGEFRLDDGRWIRQMVNQTQDGGCFLMLSDFTEIKRREEQYREAMQLAEAASEAKSAFLSTMSHELRTPLNAIIGFSEMFSGEALGPLGDPRYKSYAADILQSGHRLSAIVNTLLDFGMLQGRRIEHDAEIVDLRGVLNERGRRHARAAQQKGLVFNVNLPEEPLLARVDEKRFAQAVDHVLHNAITFTLAGSVVVHAEVDDEQVTIRVADTGIGIAPDKIETAMAPFGQINNSFSRDHGGIGMGLPLTRTIVDYHGGSLTLESAESLGTHVTIRLPRAIAQAAAPAVETWSAA